MRCFCVLVWLAGCHCGGEAQLDRLPSAGGAPVEIVELVATRTVAARLGGEGVTLDSSTPKNSVHLSYRLTARDGWAPGASIATRHACRVGDLVWGGPFSSDAGLHDLVSGESRESSASSFIPNPFAAGPPSACEFTFEYGYYVLREEPSDVQTASIGRVCWHDGTLTAGACAAELLGRRPASDLVGVEQVRAAWANGAQGRVLGFEGAFTIGAASDSVVFAVAACARDPRPPKTSSFSMLALTKGLEPGETFFGFGSAFSDAPFTNDARCTIEARRRPNSGPSDAQTSIASWCLDGGSLREGACDGLAPGAVRMAVSMSDVRLVRGAHVEGPFPLTPGAAAELAPVLASIREAGDESVVIAAPSDYPFQAMTAITDAIAAAQLPMALAGP